MPPWLINLLLTQLPGLLNQFSGGGGLGPAPGAAGAPAVNPIQEIIERQAPGSVSRNLFQQLGLVGPPHGTGATNIPTNPNTNVRRVGPLTTVSQSGLPVFDPNGPTSKVQLPVTGNPDLGFRAPRPNGTSITDLFVANQRRQDFRSRTPNPFTLPSLIPTTADRKNSRRR